MKVSSSNGSPLFSIVSVTLNCRENALLTARSVHQQDFTDFQYIVKDGGSMDGTSEVLHGQFPSTRLIVCEDTGIYDAMNQALPHVQGTYIHFLNAGDTYSDRSSLGQLAAAVVSNNYPDLLACYVRINPTNDTSCIPSPPSKYFLYRHGFCHQAVFFKKHLFQQYGLFDATLKLKADHDFIFRCLIQKTCSLAIVPAVLVNYAGGGVSDGVDANARLDQERRIVIRRYFPLPSRMLFFLLQEATLWRWRRRIMQGTNTRLKGFLNTISQKFNRA